MKGTAEARDREREREAFDAPPILFNCDANGGHWNWNWKRGREITESQERRIPSGWELRPLCIPVMTEAGISENDRGRREQATESQKERGWEWFGCHVMEMIPSTFPHYIAHSLELTFIFTCTEATVSVPSHTSLSVLLIRLNVSDVLLTPVLSVFLWLWLIAAPICILSLVTWKAGRKMWCSRKEQKHKGTWRSEGMKMEEGAKKKKGGRGELTPSLFWLCLIQRKP